MIVQSQMITTCDVNIEINEITLLSVEEYETHKDAIPPLEDWWWLRSPGDYGCSASIVYGGGSVSYRGGSVNCDSNAVRPVVVLRLSESEIGNLKIGDKLKIAGYTWTIISENMALCDKVVDYTYFRQDYSAPDANVYEASDIKAWLESWAKDNGIEVEHGTEHKD